MRLNPGSLHFISLKLRSGIIANFPGIPGFQSPTRTGYHRTGDLASGQNFRDAELNLGIEGREVRQANDGIGGVQSDADNVRNGKRIRHTSTLRKFRSDAREMRCNRV